MVQFLSSAWQNLSTPQVFEEWKPFGVVTGVIEKSGVFNDTPLYDYMSKLYADEGKHIKKKIDIACVDANSGNYVVFNETVSNPVKAILSSASIPFVFPTQVWDNGVVCIDGGSFDSSNLVSAAERCRD